MTTIYNTIQKLQDFLCLLVRYHKWVIAYVFASDPAASAEIGCMTEGCLRVATCRSSVCKESCDMLFIDDLTLKWLNLDLRSFQVLTTTIVYRALYPWVSVSHTDRFPINRSSGIMPGHPRNARKQRRWFNGLNCYCCWLTKLISTSSLVVSWLNVV